MTTSHSRAGDARAGIHISRDRSCSLMWMPAFAGMTKFGEVNEGEKT